jgi:membrane peptidoglycan carboxypeptidase
MKSIKFIKQYLTYSVGYVLKGKESVLDRLVNDLKVAEYITETAYKKAVNSKLKEAQKAQEKECEECKDEYGDCEDCRKKAEARKKRSTRKKTTTK